jgi:hypothetical protein
MQNIGAVVNTLDKVERVRGLENQEELMDRFKFLTSDTNISGYLKRVVEGAIDNAVARENDEREKKIIEEKYPKTRISTQDMLSGSFLTKQLKISDITSDKDKPSVSQWIVSATFTFVAIRIKGRTYGYIQTYRLTGDRDISVNMTQDDETRYEKTRLEKGSAGATSVPLSDKPSSGNKNGRISPWARRSGEVAGSQLTQAPYRSTLPPELELELELLS